MWADCVGPNDATAAPLLQRVGAVCARGGVRRRIVVITALPPRRASGERHGARHGWRNAARRADGPLPPDEVFVCCLQLTDAVC